MKAIQGRIERPGEVAKKLQRQRLEEDRKNERRELIAALKDVLVWQATFERGECRRGELEQAITDAKALLEKIGEPLVIEGE